MARRKTVTTTVSDGDEVELPTSSDTPVGEEVDVLDQLRAMGVDQPLRYNVTKTSGKPGTQTGWCQSYTHDDFSPEAIRDTYGGGKYVVRVTNPRGQIVKTASLEVMEPIKAPVPTTPAPTLAGSIAEVKPLLDLIHPQQGSSNEVLMAFMKSQGEILTSILNRPVPTPPPGPPPLSIADILALFAALKPAQQDSPVKTLMEGLKLGKEFAGSGDGETGMMDVAAKGFEMIGQLAKNQPAPAPRMRVNPTVTRVPEKGNTPAQPAAVTEQPKEGDTMGAHMLQQLQWLQRQLQALVYQASRNADPALYAEVMMDNLPPIITEEDIAKRIGEPTGIDDLIKVDGRVEKYREWFERFRMAVLEILQDESDDDGELTGEENPNDGLGGTVIGDF